MSLLRKIRKLFRNPRLFFEDALRGRFGQGDRQGFKTISGSHGVPKKITGATGAFSVSHLRIVQTPRVLLHSGEGDTGQHHMRMWIPCLEESGVSFAVLTRNPKLYNYVRETYPEVSVALATTPEHVETVVKSLPMARAVLYPSNTGNNTHILRFNHLTHVFVGHGDSDKSASAHKFFRAYDEIWVAGDAHIDRFRNAGFNLGHLKFVKVGRPTLFNAVSSSEKTPWISRFDRPNVMYLPTWEGVYEEQSYSSLAIAPELLTEALRAVNGVGFFKLHPQTGMRKPLYKSAESAIVRHLTNNNLSVESVDRRATVESIITSANIFICDISAVITDCLAANAPIFVYRPRHQALKVSESNMQLDQYAYMFSDADELRDGLMKLMTEGDTLAQRREEAQQYLMGKQEILERKFTSELLAISRRDGSLSAKAHE
jgi:hypothetical protein